MGTIYADQSERVLNRERKKWNELYRYRFIENVADFADVSILSCDRNGKSDTE